MRPRTLGLRLSLALALAITTAVGSIVPAAAASSELYIVQLRQLPVVSYPGDIAGLPATKPAKGTKIDPLSTKVLKYIDFLTKKQSQALAKVGVSSKVYSYTFSFNGFSARLTKAQADALRKQADVVAVTKNEIVEVDTSSTPHFLGLDAPGGLWDQLGGATGTKTRKGAGENIVIGVVDSGIWPQSKSFSDRDANGKLVYSPLSTGKFKCTPGENLVASDCNQKLVGARFFNGAWGGSAALEAQRPWEFMSARDYNGHGTHTASTAGGNYGVAANGPAAVFDFISGMAPRARVAAYKALWSTQSGDTASGATADLVAAIDQAVADGVDVINYSVSGSLTEFDDPVEIAFLFAADAGVFVSASAGNSGPTASTVAHPAPWLTTVAAGTHNRDGQGSVTLGNGAKYDGASLAAAAVTAPLIDATAAGASGADSTKLALCYGSSDGDVVLDPAKVAGKIVVCDRGTTPRTNKSLAVQEAGGVGMILVNTSTNSINADFHTVPTVHLQNTDRAAVKAYAATAGATATIAKATLIYTAAAPFTASFSSRGPLQAGGGDLLKPDVIAPGQDILAAVAPPGNHGLNFNLLSGTSMSAPHVAGLAALLMQKYPSWSPMAIKSALMTSAYDVLDGDSTSPGVIFRQGAGHVKPNSAADPGLVYDSGWNQWLAFLCGTTSAVGPTTCTTLKGMGYSTDPSDLNTPSIAIGELAGVQTVKRTVTNVGSSSEEFTASVTGLTGIKFDLPSSFTLAKGASATFEVTFTNQSAALNSYVGGQLTLTGDKHHVVRVPVVLKPIAMSAPAQVSGTGGLLSYPVTFGYTGSFSATARGLVPAAVSPGTVADDPTDGACSLTSPNAQLVSVPIPAGTTYARFSLFDADVNPGSDLDLCVYRGNSQVGSSGSGTSAEEVNLVNPAADTYTVVVQGWGVTGSTPFKLHTWLLDSSDAGNLTVAAPRLAAIGTTGTVSLTFSGLAAGTKYLGSVAYTGTSGLPDPTIVRVDTP